LTNIKKYVIIRVSLLNIREVIIIDTLKRLRINAKYKQKEIAEKLGITQGAVSQWELGLCVPDIKYLLILANMYNCSVETLIKAIQATA